MVLNDVLLFIISLEVKATSELNPKSLGPWDARSLSPAASWAEYAQAVQKAVAWDRDGQWADEWAGCCETSLLHLTVRDLGVPDKSRANRS